MKRGVVLTCLLIGAVVLHILTAIGCSPPPFGLIGSLEIGIKGNFQVELMNGYPNNNYTDNTQTWCYNVTVLAEKGDLSHWCLDLCDEPEHRVLDWSGPAERIEHTAPTWDEGAYGHVIKWDGTTLEPGESAMFCFTLEGLYESTQVEWFAFDGAPWGWEDPRFADTGWTVGPSCTLLCTPPTAYSLTISSTYGGSTTAIINPATVIGPGETKTIFDIPADTTISLAAEAHTNYEFTGWTGNPIDGVTEATTTIVMQDNYEVTAHFATEDIPVTPPSVTVGWKTSPVNKFAVLAPWIALFTVIIFSSIVLKRRRA